MKIYLIIITIVAVLALAAAGYFFWQSGRSAGLAADLDACQKDKGLLQGRLDWASGQLDKIKQTVAVFSATGDSFMIPGDLKALTVGSKEALVVEQKIDSIADSKDRMMIEGDWTDFKRTLRLNALFGFFQKLSENMERILEQEAGSPPAQ